MSLHEGRTQRPIVPIPDWVTGRFYTPGAFGLGGDIANRSMAQSGYPGCFYNVVHYQPNDIVWTSVSLEVTVALVNSYVRIGLYNMNLDDGYPYELLADFGTFDTSAIGVKTIVISQTVRKGLYYVTMALYQGSTSSYPQVKATTLSNSPMGSSHPGTSGLSGTIVSVGIEPTGWPACGLPAISPQLASLKLGGRALMDDPPRIMIGV